MNLLQKAVNEQAYLKAGALGFPGSGKSYTASMLAIAISKFATEGKPVAFFDTESGSDFLIPKFDAAGVELMRVKSKAFKDLLAVGKEAEGQCSVLIVDSITHIWQEVCEAYLAQVNEVRKRKKLYLIKKLEFQHWADVKRAWAEWTTFYLNSKLHVIVCGRAGYEYEFVTNDETDKKELQKAGTKMRVEGEFGFEPSLLIEMERVSRGATPGAGWIHRAHILKDRTDSINGMAFDFGAAKKKLEGDEEWKQVYQPFAPVLARLNLGGEHLSVDASRTSRAMFEDEGDGEGNRRAKRVDIALEEIQGTLVAIWPGQDAASKRLKQSAIEALFSTRSWTKVESLPLERLEAELKVLKAFEEKARPAFEGDESPASTPDGVATVMQQAREALAPEPNGHDIAPDASAIVF